MSNVGVQEFPNFASVAQLPNTAGATVQSHQLVVGAIASVSGTLYVCTTATVGAAVWALVSPALATAAPADVTKATAQVGVSSTSARADHKHDISTATPGAVTIATAASEGTSSSLARADHVHSVGTPATPLGLAATGSAGSSSVPAREDHVHPSTGSTGLVYSRWNQTNLNQWSNSGASRFQGNNITSGDISLATATGRGGYTKFGLTSNIASSASSGYACMLYDDNGAIASLNRFRLRMVLGNAINTTGTGAFGFLFGSTANNGTGHYAIGITQVMASSTLAGYKVEAGARASAAGTVTGTGISNGLQTSDGGHIWEMDVEVVPVVVTNPDVSWTASMIATAAGASRGNTIGPAGTLYATYTGWNGLTINRVGIFFSWTTTATHACTLDVHEFMILKHPMDW